MPVALDLNTLSEPLRAVFQSVFGERDEACQQRDEARLEHRRVEVVENRRQVRHEYQTIRAPEGSIKGAKNQTILGFARASWDYVDSITFRFGSRGVSIFRR